MKSSLPEADRHDEIVTQWDDYQTPACWQAGARFPVCRPGRHLTAEKKYKQMKKTIIGILLLLLVFPAY
ncbi:MAG: hypothetical protein WD431_02415, partial [Cyclobacteriaceae bacterium]